MSDSAAKNGRPTMEEQIQAAAKAAPPPTEAQIQRLAVLLSPRGRSR